ncbi:hypothetical protein ANCCAN_14010 [Ancylostoma caninum]|uniref:Uncharacterized protein n=1 Tax=Ancylostoma caninum TaxID=29170 RepID=A0A368GAP2_ANCCA|nr:hypothetical protein ANCCAN_14010 [Ancylostoma caninum]
MNNCLCSKVTRCWSAWSPCTVTCVPITPEAIEADFARRWRVWLHNRCPNVTPPNQLTEFKKCSASVPPCLELETILQPSPRTIYRLWALVLLMLVSVIPSLYICCKSIFVRFHDGPMARKRKAFTSPKQAGFDSDDRAPRKVRSRHIARYRNNQHQMIEFNPVTKLCLLPILFSGLRSSTMISWNPHT